MVVDEVIRHWVTLVVGEEVGPDGFGQAVQWLAKFLYANYDLLSSPITDRLQADLDFLAGLFYWGGLQTNLNKTVGMVCQPCNIFGRHLDMTYMRQITRVGSSFWEWQHEIVRCL